MLDGRTYNTLTPTMGLDLLRALAPKDQRAPLLNVHPSDPSAPSTMEDLLRGNLPPEHDYLSPSNPAHPINQQNLGGMLGASPPTQLAGDVVPLPIAPGPMAGPPSDTAQAPMVRSLIRTNHPASVGLHSVPESLLNQYYGRRLFGLK